MGDLSGRTTGFFQGCHESKCACVSVCGEGRGPGETYYTGVLLWYLSEPNKGNNTIKCGNLDQLGVLYTCSLLT